MRKVVLLQPVAKLRMAVSPVALAPPARLSRSSSRSRNFLLRFRSGSRKFSRLAMFSICFVFWAFALPASARGITEENGKTIIHVKVHSLPDPSNPETGNRADVEVVKQFYRDFPEIFRRKYLERYRANPEKYGDYDWENVEIKLEAFSSIIVEGVESDLLAIAGGMAPDILYINFRKSDNYIRNNFLYPLDKYYATLTPEEIEWHVHPAIKEVCYREGPDGKMRWWTLPYGGVLGKVLLFRKDLFDANGIAYPDENWTWDEFMDAARKLTDPANGTYGVRLGRGKHESWYWCNFLWSAGGEVMEFDEEQGEWRCTFDSDAAVKALDFYTRLSAERWIDNAGEIRRGYAAKDASEISDRWERGEIGMMFSYIRENVLASIDPNATGMAPLPTGPSGVRGGELNSRMFGMFSQIKEPAVRDAAWEYMIYYDSLKAQKIRTRIMIEGGYGQFVNPRLLRLFGYDDVLKLTPRGWEDTFNIAIETGRPEPYGKNSNFAYEQMTIPLQRAEQLELRDQLPPVGTPERFEVLKTLLQRSCARANDVMIGTVSPRERMWRRILAGTALSVIAVAFVLVFRRIFRIFTPPAETGGEIKSKWAFKKYKWAYILLVPAVASIFTWQYVPLLRGSYMAFFDYKIIGDSIFVGVDNFGDMLYDGVWWRSVYNAFRYSFLVMAMTFLPPIVLAVFLQEVPRGKILFRTIFYLPAVVTGMVTMLLWKQFYQPYGMLNAIILNIPAIGFLALGVLLLAICLAFASRLRFYEMWLGMTCFVVGGIVLFLSFANLAVPILFQRGELLLESLAYLPGRLFEFTPEAYHWLTDSNTAMICCVIPMVWAGMGPGCLIYLAALKGIPDDYYEAADLDGATFIDKILFVVFPTLKALIIINFVGVFINSWMRSTGMILIMTGGAADTETAGLHIWYKAFTYLQMGPATAMAWTLGFILIGFTVYQLQILSKVEFRAAGQNK